MKVALAQVNPCVGDLMGNVERCLTAVQTVLPKDPDLIVFPEMVIPGSPPRDILFDSSFIQAVLDAIKDLAHQTRSEPPILIGSIFPAIDHAAEHPGLFNAALLIKEGEVHLAAAKRLLPTHDVFYEKRWFLPGSNPAPITIAGKRVGILIGEDLWDEEYADHPPADLLEAGAELMICLAASPFRQGIMTQRLHHARRAGCPLVYINLWGANDELIYDGRSFVINAAGQVIAKLAGFQEQLLIVDLEKDSPVKEIVAESEDEIFHSLVLGVRDFFEKNGLERAYLGLSGGVDSAVVAAITTEALGPDRVTAIAIPSRFSDPRSLTSARELAQRLGISFEVVDLERLHQAAEETLGDLLEVGTTGENAQPRLRSMILMSYVNHYGGESINTSNKTELSVGYVTLYGDMAGTLCPIADLTKPEVYALANWINRTFKTIPTYILERQPTAELKPDQVDPFDYQKLAPEIEDLVQGNRSNFALRSSEHKRWQMGVVLKVSAKAFGSGRMIPITRR